MEKSESSKLEGISTPIKTATQRRAHSLTFLKSIDFPCDLNLPLLPVETEISMRSAPEIGEKIIIVASIYAILQEPQVRPDIVPWLRQSPIWHKISAFQRCLLESTTYTDKEALKICACLESINMKLWALGRVERVIVPTEQVDRDELIAMLKEILQTREKFIQTAQRRSASTILDMLDITFCMYKTALAAYRNKKPISGDFSMNLLEERYGGMAWIAHFEGDGLSNK